MRGFVCLLTLCLACSPPLRAGELQQLRDDVRQEKPPPPESADSKFPDCHESDDLWGEMLGIVFGDAIFYSLTTPWWIPRLALEEVAPAPAGFASAPYAEEHPGYLVVTAPVPDRLFENVGRVSFDSGTNFNGAGRVTGRLLVETLFRLGLDATWDYRHEQTDLLSDHLHTGDANLVWRFAQGEQWLFRTGLGCNWLADSQDVDFGFNFTYGFDYFPRKPWVISAVLDAGTLGRSALVRGNVSVGVLWRSVELYTGYDYYHVGRTDLHGPMIGVRYWW